MREQYRRDANSHIGAWVRTERSPHTALGQAIQPEGLIESRAVVGLALGLGHLVQVQDGEAREEVVDKAIGSAPAAPGRRLLVMTRSYDVPHIFAALNPASPSHTTS
jgi:hypothetical protein